MTATLPLIAAIAAPAILGSLVWAATARRPVRKAIATTFFVLSVAATVTVLGIEAAGGLEEFLTGYRR